jgi:hypothetical protein
MSCSESTALLISVAYLLQPVVRGLVAAGKAFVQSEEERVILRSRLDELSRKLF